ncbi:MAG: acyl-CoA/acyl-ACP dehydrogenase [bacterium]|nr:acyl-CoA dehydrogenase [Deltaproteobacteria bacterium]MCP4905390.1 acyl-CoA/acyl-ACP dehydrogenase [bacterium]
MDFGISEEQEALRDLARQILQDRANPERLRELENEGHDFDRELWAEFARANLLGLAIDEEYGGMGFGFSEVALLLEEVGRAVAPIPALATLVMGALPIARFGTPAQRSRLLAGVASGDEILSAALIEPDSDDPRELTTQAIRDADGWRLTGEKICVPAARVARRILVPAKAEGGIGLFLVDPRAPGVELAPQQSTSLEAQFVIRLTGVHVETNDVLADSESGSQALDWTLERSLAALCAMQLGVCEAALRMTADYASTREQFGRKLSTFQAVGHQAADAYIDIECLRVTTQQAVWRLDVGKVAHEQTAIAKVWAGDAGHRVSYAAQHLHGGIGVDLDYPLHRYCFWAKQIELTLGSSAHHIDRLGDWAANA